MIFVGPKAKNISAMGNKSASKVFLKPLGVPFIPGYFGKEQDLKSLRA
jgi:acetyl/propionyl-CoA carboxylase alpha subunit